MLSFGFEKDLDYSINCIMKLIIVESPTKARTLNKYLGSGFKVEASMGHIRDLPKSKLAVDVENRFEPEYIQVRGKSQLVQKLKKLASEAEMIYLAMDPDREGEAIAWHVKELLSGKSKIKTKAGKVGKDKFKRVTFHEVTKQAVLKALETPGELDLPRVDAQQARRVLDRLVGYKLSPLLWKKVRRGLSAGRVQSVALRMIVEREAEVLAYKPQEYWEVGALLGSTDLIKGKTSLKIVTSMGELVPDEGELVANLVEVGGKKVVVVDPKKEQLLPKDAAKSIQLLSHEVVAPIVADLQEAKYRVTQIDKKERKRQPKPPFTTSSLQQAAASKYGWSGKQTMSVAQRLFEAGMITYHRTDSLSLSTDSVNAARDFIAKKYGDKYLPSKPVFYKTKSKSAQEAHEAIRPTNLEVSIETSQSRDLDGKHDKLFTLIRQRFLACQMVPAVYDQTSVLIEAVAAKKYMLRASGGVIRFNGWLAVYGNGMSAALSDIENNKNKGSKEESVVLPELKQDQTLSLKQLGSEQKATMPPPRFNDASLVKELERLGIGRPSTYASIIGVLDDRGYVERREKRFYPTDIGKVVVEFLKSYFEQVMDYEFTAQMEDQFDEIALGKKKWRNVIGDFYKPFAKKLEDVGESANRMEVPVEKTGDACPECKVGEVIIRTGRFGKFFACDKFPECKYTKQYVETLEGFACPDCGMEVVVKKTRAGRTFYGCSGYPGCNYASWQDPRTSTTSDSK